MAEQEPIPGQEDLIYLNVPVNGRIAQHLDDIAHREAHNNNEPYNPTALCRKILEQGIAKKAQALRLLFAVGLAALTTITPANEVSADGGKGINKYKQPSAEMIVGTILGGTIGTVLGVAGGIHISYRLGLLPKNFPK